MGRKKKQLPKYGTVTLNGSEYFRTRIEDADGKRVALYAKTAEELYEKVEEAKRQIEEASFRRATPTVAEYCERWLLMQSAHIRTTTLADYSSKVKNYIVALLGHMSMVNVTTDDVRLALVAVSEKSNSVYQSVHMLYKAIFNAAVDSHIIDYSPCERISAKGGKPQKDKDTLTDEQIVKLLSAIKGLPPYVFVMIGLYAGLRREEILGLQWDSVYLDGDAPYISVRRTWHFEHNRRTYIAENVDPQRTPLNIEYCYTPIEEAYHHLFGEALAAYNEKQKRKDRRIENYYEYIRKGKQEKPFYEVIFQIGNKDDMANGSENEELAKAILDKSMQSFQERNPQLHVFSAHLHMDEATPHLHIDFIPFTTRSKRGLSTRVSLKQALADQGITGEGRSMTERAMWVQKEKEALAEIMLEHSIEWDQKGEHREHLSVLEYKREQRTQELAQLEKTIKQVQKQKISIQAVELKPSLCRSPLRLR